jgi:hypothetical protein
MPDMTAREALDILLAYFAGDEDGTGLTEAVIARLRAAVELAEAVDRIGRGFGLQRALSIGEGWLADGPENIGCGPTPLAALRAAGLAPKEESHG